MDMVKMGSFLAELRKEQKLTQAELGEKLGVTNKTVSRWETGTYMPPVEILEELSRLYGLIFNFISYNGLALGTSAFCISKVFSTIFRLISWKGIFISKNDPFFAND